MKELLVWFGGYPIWVQVAVLAQLTVIVVLLVFFQGPRHPSTEKELGRSSPTVVTGDPKRAIVVELIARLEAVERKGEAYTDETTELAARAESVAFAISPSSGQEIGRLRKSSNEVGTLAADVRTELLRIRDALDTGTLQGDSDTNSK